MIELHLQKLNWRVTGLTWDDGALRNSLGYRVRQTGTVVLTQYTPTAYVQRSVAQRTRSKAKHAKTPVGKAVSSAR